MLSLKNVYHLGHYDRIRSSWITFTLSEAWKSETTSYGDVDFVLDLFGLKRTLGHPIPNGVSKFPCIPESIGHISHLQKVTELITIVVMHPFHAIMFKWALFIKIRRSKPLFTYRTCFFLFFPSKSLLCLIMITNLSAKIWLLESSDMILRERGHHMNNINNQMMSLATMEWQTSICPNCIKITDHGPIISMLRIK